MKELFDTTVFDAFEMSKKCILTKNICLETTEFQLVFCKYNIFFRFQNNVSLLHIFNK